MIARFHLHQNKAPSALPYILNLKNNYTFLLPPPELKNKNSDQKREETARSFCKQLNGRSNKYRKACLKLITRIKINPTALSFCDQLKTTSYFKVEDKFKCLKSLTVSELPSLNRLKKYIKKLSNQAQTKL